MDHQDIDFSHPYLGSQIIAYIGNKRRLLPLIAEAVGRCSPRGEGRIFLDLFAGSGSVSRLAKHLGFEVISNDWEDFSSVINGAYIGIDKAELEAMFPEHGGVHGMLDHLNSLPDPVEEELYIAKHYAPRDSDINKADFKKERLFYTRENGLIIDKIRSEIEKLYPESIISDPTSNDSPNDTTDNSSVIGPISNRPPDSDVRHVFGAGAAPRTPKEERRGKEKSLLIALLLYGAATHTNTSGVFKACHKGFGGHGGDALKRILGRITLQGPVLIDSPYAATIYKRDANELVSDERLKQKDIFIAYIDPPYNQHQYGSNYHLLNTIAAWDKPDVDNRRNHYGEIVTKAAIRKDWVRTKSRYCYRDSAVDAFSSLIRTLDARYLLISYSTEGIIPFEKMMEICANKGRVEIVTNEYIKYRGGKQSISRLNKNIEFVLIVDTEKKHTKKQDVELQSLLERKKLSVMFDKRYRLNQLKSEFSIGPSEDGPVRGPETKWPANGPVRITVEERTVVIPTRYFFELLPSDDFEDLTPKGCRIVRKKLEKCVCRNKEEELAELLDKIAAIRGEGGARIYAVGFLPHILKKIAHKKYRGAFEYWLQRIRELERSDPDLYALIRKKLDEVERSATKRFTN